QRRTPARRKVRMRNPSDARRRVWYSAQIERKRGSAIPATPTHTTGTPHSRAFSANTIGKRPAQASRPTGSGPPELAGASGGSNWKSGARISPVLQPEVLLDPLDVVEQPGQLAQSDESPLCVL